MSLSKLESLPNEILCDIVEKYINGVDLLLAFNHQLNGRFDTLIAKSQRLRFDFMQCKKDDFRFCMGLLPASVNTVQELALSDEDTPGQIHGFLSFFPSFEIFQQLRRLYFHFDGDAIRSDMIERALISLSRANIDTLSIKGTNTTEIRHLSTIITHLFLSKSLKRLSFTSNSTIIDYNDLVNISSNMEYLTLCSSHCELKHLKCILQCAPHLKYLDIKIVRVRYYRNDKTTKNQKADMMPISELRTLILSFEQAESITIADLSQYLKSMPMLNRLEIRGHKELMDADAWEMLLKSSLPVLNHFSLQTSTASYQGENFHGVLATFQGVFWTSRKNFNVIITKHKAIDFNPFNTNRIRAKNDYEYDLPVSQYWTAPNRDIHDTSIGTDKIQRWYLDNSNTILPHHYRDDTIKCLAVADINSSLLKWITTFTDCSQITTLAITDSKSDPRMINSLSTYTINIRSLHLHFDLLIATKDAFEDKHKNLKRLNISPSEHRFYEEDIIDIAKLFPYIEHLIINTSDLYNVPLLKTYLPYLRSLTFMTPGNQFYFYDDYERENWCYQLRLKTSFLFKLDGNAITVWLDQATLEEPYWQTYAPNPSSSAIDQSAGDKKTKKRNIFSSLNPFK